MDNVEFVFADKEKDIKALILFWNVSKPLSRILDTLPDTEKFEASLRPVFDKAIMKPGITPEEIFANAKSTEISVQFNNLSEPLFERLVFRFRPFYMKTEPVYFFKITKLFEHNSFLAPELEAMQLSWENAVFWGAMGMPNHEPQINAEEVIKIGLYSRYFHFDVTKRQKALEYEKLLGADMFRVALVSSVWKRSQLVIQLANGVEKFLYKNGYITDADLAGEIINENPFITLRKKGNITITPVSGITNS